MADSVVASKPDPSVTNFIKASCKATLYPLICYQSLSSYAHQIQQNELDIAQVALYVSLSKARFTSMFVTNMTKVAGIKPREFQAVKDCINNMGDTVAQLNRSIYELRHMDRSRGQDFLWRMSNVQTWVSAALTNENVCANGFTGSSMEGNVKAAITSRIITVAQVTSNSLALVNRFAARHRAGADADTNTP